MPVLGSGDLRDVGFVAVHKPSELHARPRRSSYRQQEMPHHRHSVTAENEPLNVCEVKRRIFRRWIAIGLLMFRQRSAKPSANKPRALHRRRSL
jgi:hypothetical protein